MFLRARWTAALVPKAGARIRSQVHDRLRQRNAIDAQTRAALKAWIAGRVRMARKVAKNVIGRLHFEQIRMGGCLSLRKPWPECQEGRRTRRMPRGVHLGATTGAYRNLAGFGEKDDDPTLTGRSASKVRKTTVRPGDEPL